MKEKRLVQIAILLVFFLSSCSLSKTYTAKTMNVGVSGISQTPTIADLDVKETKVSGSATGSSAYTEAVKNEAVSIALEKDNADVLVEPRYVVSHSGEDVNIEVKGYPATYKNFRTVTQEDIVLSGSYSEVKTATPNQDVQIIKKKKSKAGWIIGGILVVGSIVATLIL